MSLDKEVRELKSELQIIRALLEQSTALQIEFMEIFAYGSGRLPDMQAPTASAN